MGKKKLNNNQNDEKNQAPADLSAAEDETLLAAPASDNNEKTDIPQQPESAEAAESADMTASAENTEEAGSSENSGESVSPDAPGKKKLKLDLFQVIRILCAVCFVVFTGLFINEVVYQPWRANQVASMTRELYSVTITPAAAAPTKAPEVTADPALTPVPTQDPNRDEQGRLLQFQKLLEANPDTKGWIDFPGTNIQYAVVQRNDDPDFYLTHDFNGDTQKAGSIFMDKRSSVEENTKNIVIHGHNMKSTDSMFHHLEHLLKLSYFKEHTEFNFDTLYQTGEWKIISVFQTNGSDKKEPFFDYMKATFKDSSEFLNFVYQLRIRSIYNLDQVDINENDQICTLSTCYKRQIDDYRLVIVARKVREGEDTAIDTDWITTSKNPLYPQSYYNNYGGTAPVYPDTFEEALEQGIISWYMAPESGN
jgi:sortase B